MDKLQMIWVFLCGLIFYSYHLITASTLETIVRCGDNITLYCDLKASTGVYITWFRNCSHEYQPSLVVKLGGRGLREMNYKFPRYTFLKNDSSNSYDLEIINITSSDEGLYYCGTFEPKVKQDQNRNIFNSEIYIFGNMTTRITLYTETHLPKDCGLCWKLLFSLCPVVSALSALFTSLLVYMLCQKPVNNQADKKRGGTLRQTEERQDENVCYAALEIQQPSQRTKRKTTIQSSDFSTYSAVKTFHVEENNI